MNPYMEKWWAGRTRRQKIQHRFFRRWAEIEGDIAVKFPDVWPFTADWFYQQDGWLGQAICSVFFKHEPVPHDYKDDPSLDHCAYCDKNVPGTWPGWVKRKRN